MKTLLFLISTAVFASHAWPQVGWDKQGHRVYKRGAGCYYSVHDEFEQRIDCKDVLKTKPRKK